MNDKPDTLLRTRNSIFFAMLGLLFLWQGLHVYLLKILGIKYYPIIDYVCIILGLIFVGVATYYSLKYEKTLDKSI